MASKTIDEFLKTASAKDLENTQKAGQELDHRGIQPANEGYQAMPPTDPSKTNATEQKLDTMATQETTPEESQRGAQLIKQHMPDGEQAKAADQGKELEKNNASIEQDKDR